MSIVEISLPSDKIKVHFTFRWNQNNYELNGDGDFTLTIGKDILDPVKCGMFFVKVTQDRKEYVQNYIKEKHGLTALRKDIFVEFTSYSYA